jgi:thymidine kinase
MAKLYFRYGTVGSAKTLNLLAVTHNYQQQNKRVFLLKPRLDVRFGENEVTSRAGLSKTADILITDETLFDMNDFKGVDCIVVDEAQFLSKSVIDQFRAIASVQKIPVICYGLRTDFRGNLFEGSKRLFEIADSIEEIKTTCAFCNRKGIFNLKLVDGKPTVSGPTIELGTEERYLPACANCYRNALETQYVSDRTPCSTPDKNVMPI